jgi:hypothetical protein
VYYNFCFYYILLRLCEISFACNAINVLDTIKPGNVQQSDIDNLVNEFSSVLLDAAKDTFDIYI